MWNIFKDAFTGWKKDNVAVWSAALSYYTIFSLSPLLLIVISIAGFFFGEAAVKGQVFSQIQGLLGEDGAAFMQTTLAHARKPSTNIITSIIGIVTLLLGAGGVFGQLKQALNHIWKVEARPKSGIIPMIRDRFLSFSMIAVIGFLLIVSLLASTVITAFTTYLGGFLPINGIVLEIFNFFISLGTMTVAFALIFKVLPDIRLPWRYTWTGGFVTAILFTIGKTLIGWYIGHSSIGSTYGAAASIIIILLWSYYTAQILFFGAEYTKAEANHNHVVIPANEFAITKAQIRQEDPKEKMRQTIVTLFGYVLSGFFYQTFLQKRKK